MNTVLPVPRFRALAIFLAGLLLVPAAGPVAAQTLTWGAGGAGGSGTWDTTTSNWYNGSANVPWTNGDSAVFAGSVGNVSIAGSVTASQVTFTTPGYILQNFFLDGTSNGLAVQTDVDATISSSIFGASPYNTPFTKTGAGALLVNSGSGPVFFGSINVASGELRYGSTSFLSSSTPYVLGNTSTAALTFGMSTATVASLAGGGAAGGVVRPNDTSGNFTLSISGSANATYAGTLAGNGNAVLSLQKSGSATQTLTNASYGLTGTATVSGGRLALAGPGGALPNISALVINAGGTFQLDNSTDVNQTRLASALPVTLNGGTMTLTGSAASQDVHQTVGALNVASGASAVSVTSAGSGAAQLIFSVKPLRTNAATVSFSGGGHITLTGVNNVNGIVGGYATVGADWAAVDAGGNVSAFTGYTSDTGTASSPDNLRVTAAAGTTALAGVTSRNSLNLVNIGSTPATLDLGANSALDLTGGGLLTSGSGGWIVQGRKFSSSGGEVIITNQSALTISSAIAEAVPATALTKSGAGTLVLSGTNTYSGATTINQGTVQVSADVNLGGGKAVALNGGTLQATAGFTSAKSLQGSGGTLDTGANTVAFTGGVNTGSITKAGAGVLSLTGQVGSVTVGAGTLRLTELATNSAASATLVSGRLEASGSGLGNVFSLGGSNVVLSPGAHGQAQTLTIGFLTAAGGPAVVDFDLGSAGSDLLSVTYNLNLTGSAPGVLFRFNNLGGVRTGTAYPLLQLPSSQAFSLGTGSFGIDPASTAAGYQGVFTIVNGMVDVTFSAVPEPSAAVALLGGLLGAWAGRGCLRRRAAREKCGN